MSPSAMQGWTFYDDQRGVACADLAICRLVSGPAGQPSGSGSAELATASAADGKALILAAYKNTRLDQITAFRYSTYRQTADAGNNLAIALQLNVDFDLTDAATGYQGRLVYEPYRTNGGGVTPGAWQTWDAKAGKWWGTRASVQRGGVTVANPCVQSSPCTWAQILGANPNIGIHASYGAVVLKAGSGWAAFRGNVDALQIGVGGVTTTYDFELQEPSSVPAVAPDSTPAIVDDTAQFVTLSNAPSGLSVHRSVLSIEFYDTVSQSGRAAVIASVGGRVIGGARDAESGDGPYYVQVADDSTGRSNMLLGYELSQRPEVISAYALTMTPAENMMGYRRPTDGAGMEHLGDRSPEGEVRAS